MTPVLVERNRAHFRSVRLPLYPEPHLGSSECQEMFTPTHPSKGGSPAWIAPSLANFIFAPVPFNLVLVVILPPFLSIW